MGKINIIDSSDYEIYQKVFEASDIKVIEEVNGKYRCLLCRNKRRRGRLFPSKKGVVNHIIREHKNVVFEIIHQLNLPPEEKAKILKRLYS